MKQKTINVLQQNSWYHATTQSGWDSICELGVKAKYNLETSKDLDFGYGFYLTPSADLAESFIERLIMADIIEKQQPVIIEFDFVPLEYFGTSYKCKVFEAFDDEFAHFVFDNRTCNDNGVYQHEFDLIYGVMSDSVPTRLLAEYHAGIITKDDVVNGLQKSNRMKQLSLHSQLLCDILSPTNAYTYTIDTKCRKELDINDYKSTKEILGVC